MSSEKRTEISSLGEFGLIEHLAEKVELRQNSSVYGIGDDAAVLEKNQTHFTLVSTDLLLEGIHFDLMYSPLKHLGYKAVVVNLSDIYAMNGTPEQVTVSIGLSNRFSVEAIDELYAGIVKACEFYGVDLVGGDTSSSKQGLCISVTAIGTVEKSKVCYRNGAKEGDLICGSGNFGAAYLGLQILEREKQIFLSQEQAIQPEFDGQSYILERQLKPEARMDIIRELAKANIVPTSMIDVSDGLSTDLHHICRQSGVGAIIEESGVSIHPDSEFTAIAFNMDPITCALSGGEDYELVFTIKQADLEALRLLPDIYIMGEIVPKSEGLKLHTKGGNIHEVPVRGWAHF